MRKLSEDRKNINAIKDILMFQEILDAQTRSGDTQSSELANELFRPFLERIQESVQKENYVLDAYPYFEVRHKAVVPVAGKYTKSREYWLKLHFVWLPVANVANVDDVAQAEFTKKELAVVTKEVKKFSTKIGYPIEIIFEID